MLLIIDNYDSFTYNLYQYFGSLQPDIQVARNDKITVEQAQALAPDHIVLSPGPGYPGDAGVCVELIRALGGKIPILGVCLGHQAIGEACGGTIVPAPRLMHGKSDLISCDPASPLFRGLPPEIEAGRYHSLVIDPATLPKTLAVTAKSPDGCIMAVQHKAQPVFGIQFHPESVLTPRGMELLKNFLEIKAG